MSVDGLYPPLLPLLTPTAQAGLARVSGNKSVKNAEIWNYLPDLGEDINFNQLQLIFIIDFLLSLSLGLIYLSCSAGRTQINHCQLLHVLSFKRWRQNITAPMWHNLWLLSSTNIIYWTCPSDSSHCIGKVLVKEVDAVPSEATLLPVTWRVP